MSRRSPSATAGRRTIASVTELDVAIIGGGPAGTAAALTLLRYSKLRPVVIERTSYEGWRIGETVSPGVLPLLSYLGAESVLTAQGQRRAYATSAAWGSAEVLSRDFLFTGGGDAWHLDRARFDRALAELVEERGGAVLTESVVTRVEGGGRPARLALGVSSSAKDAGPPRRPAGAGETPAPRSITARFVIDATGRHAAFARTQGARVLTEDNLTGLVAMFEGSTDAQTATLVEAVEDGWWYSAHLPDARTVVAFMTDADIVRAGHLHECEAWLERLGATRGTQQRLVDANLVQGPVAAPAHSQILDLIAGDGWVAAGEAAVAFDPLSSMGIGYAIASGIQAARVAASTIGGNADHARAYAADIAQHYQAYLARRYAYYLIEKRWPESPFWARRRSLSS